MTERLNGADPPGSTPLSDDDLTGLRPSWVATRSDLDVAEQANIEAARAWAFGRRHVATIDQMLTIAFIDTVHRRMFGQVWMWAGARRRRETNIGVDPVDIAVQMRLVLDDARFWFEHDVHPPAERAVRLHHRLVSVHPYPNGNGRHARFIADLALHLTAQPRLTWGTAYDDEHPTAARTAYLAALRAADAGDIEPLVLFATS
jgi:Fic-DOC domain mobile mystery protein B